MRRDARWFVVGLLAVGCADAGEQRLTFTPDAPLGSEAYVCFGFPPRALGAAPLRSLAVEVPRGPVGLHHLALYALSTAADAGPFACEGMPTGAVELAVLTPSGGPLVLPDGVGLALPQEAAGLVVQAHALRSSTGPAEPMALLVTAMPAPTHLAAWWPVRAPVPAIRPHTVESSATACAVAAPATLVLAWPHMHRVGRSLVADVRHGDGTHTPLLTVDPWSFDDQRVYPLDARLATGDAVEVTCTWANESDAYVLPGPLFTDEMCELSLVAWPVDAARCAP